MYGSSSIRAMTPIPGPISSVRADDVVSLKHATDKLGIEEVENSDKEKAIVALKSLKSTLKELDKLVHAEHFEFQAYEVEMQAFTTGYVALTKQLSTITDSSQENFWESIEEELWDVHEDFQKCQAIGIGHTNDCRKSVALEIGSTKDRSFEDVRAISAKPLSLQDNPLNTPQVSEQRTENLNVDAESAWLATGIERLVELVKETGDTQINAALALLLNVPNTNRNNILSAYQAGSQQQTQSRAPRMSQNTIDLDQAIPAEPVRQKNIVRRLERKKYAPVPTSDADDSA